MIIDRDGRATLIDQALGFRFETALLYAFRLHAQQRRKGSGIPYIGHLLGVTSQVIEAGGDEDQAIAALLHDATEDQGGKPTQDAIRTLFGDRVAHIVEGCSDDGVEDLQRTSENSGRRKQHYLEHLRSQPYDVLLVSLADKLYNARAILFDLRTVGDKVWSRFNMGKEEQLEYYRGLVTAFDEATNIASLTALVKELDAIVTEIESEAARCTE